MERGMTLVEILVVVAILAVIGSIGVIISSNFYRQQSIYAEQFTLVSVLRHARSEALNNRGETDHGLYISPAEYVVFQGTSYAARDSEYDENFPRAGNLTFSGLAEIVFKKLDGSANASGTITMTNGTQTTTIAVNSEGRITW